MSTPAGFDDKVQFVWKVADKLRGNFRAHEYGQVMLPLIVLRRLDCVLASTKDAVIAKHAELEAEGARNPDPILRRVAKQSFYNTSPLTLATVIADDRNVAANLRAYIAGFSPGAADVLERYRFDDKIKRLAEAGILYQVLTDFVDLDLHPDTVSNETMGYIFEELLRKFSEMSNETAGEHYTPREVIRMMVAVLLSEDTEALTGPKPVRTVYDPAAGTGGMLTVATAYIDDLNPKAQVEVYGQELNPETWAIARSELMIKGSDPDRMVLGNTLTEDGWANKKFDYMLANPPYGVNWAGYADPIRDEATRKGFRGRFGAGLPRVSDGSFLFLQQMIAKMKPIQDNPQTPWVDGGSRIGIVLSGSPLFAGAAGSGESEIRRWILENDWLEGIIALPNDMFYNTGISTYVWIVTNRKNPDRAGTVTLIDARDLGTKMRKSLGNKRKELTDDAIREIVRLYADAIDIARQADPDPRVKVLTNEEFGYARLTVERPLRRVWRVDDDTLTDLHTSKAWTDWKIPEVTDPEQHAQTAAKGREQVDQALDGLRGQTWTTKKDCETAVKGVLPLNAGMSPDSVVKQIIKSLATTDPDAAPTMNRSGDVEPDPDLRDQENVPLPTGYLDMTSDQQVSAVQAAATAHLEAEIQPYVPDAWIDHGKTRIGYEIPFTRQFYVYTPPRPVAEIRADIDNLEAQIQEWMKGLVR